MGDQEHNSRLLQQLRRPDLARSSGTIAPSYSDDSIDHEQELKSAECQGRRHVLSLWTFELGAIITSVSALLAMAGVLFAFDGKPLTQWHAPLRPNTVIATLSTLSKSSMLMAVGQVLGQVKWRHFSKGPRSLFEFNTLDGASHGPLGSIKLLFRPKRYSLLAYIGALITILSLTMDPFVQQIISYDARVVEAHGVNATISTARVYDLQSRLTEGNLVANFEDAYKERRNRRMVSAIYTGILGSYEEIPFSCRSGSCTWDTFESLGVCNVCRDVTTYLNSTKKCYQYSSSGTLSETTAQKRACQIDENGIQICDKTTVPTIVNGDCSFRTAQGFEMNATRKSTMTGSQYREIRPLWTSSSAPLDFEDSDDLDDGSGLWTSPAPLGAFTALRFHEYEDLTSNAEEFRLQQAWDCRLSWCVKEYTDTTLKEGRMSLTPSKVTPLVKHSRASDYNAACGSENQPGPRWDFGNYNAMYKPQDLELVCGSGSDLLLPKPFLVQNDDEISAVLALQGVLTANWTTAANIGSGIGEVLYKTSDFALLMDEVARSITDTIRNGPNATDVQGKVYEAQQHIRVRWPWLIMPMTLVLGSLVILFIMMSIANERRLVWKTSALPSLFHGLSGWSQSELHYDSLHDMERRSKRMWVQLTQEDEHARLLKRGTNTKEESFI